MNTYLHFIWVYISWNGISALLMFIFSRWTYICPLWGVVYIPWNGMTCIPIFNFSKYYQIIFQCGSTSLYSYQEHRKVSFLAFDVLCIFHFSLFSWCVLPCFCTYLPYALDNTLFCAWVFLSVKWGEIEHIIFWEIKEIIHTKFLGQWQAQSTPRQIS